MYISQFLLAWNTSLFFWSMFGPFFSPSTSLILSCEVARSERLEVSEFWICVSIHFYPTWPTGTYFPIHICQASNTNSPWKSCLSSSITMSLFHFNLSDHCLKTKKYLIKLPMCLMPATVSFKYYKHLTIWLMIIQSFIFISTQENGYICSFRRIQIYL